MPKILMTHNDGSEYKKDKTGGIDITNLRFGKLMAISLVPEEDRKNSYKRREWYCHCDCGTDLIVEQRMLLGNKYQQQSCGCVRVKIHLVKTSKIENLTLEYIESFDNYEKYAFLHKALVKTLGATQTFENYNRFMQKFYYDKQFNAVYTYWLQFGEMNTFYDLCKPSIDHIIPVSRGGTNDIENLRFLTVFENLNKRDMTEEEWQEFKTITNTQSDLYIRA